ncbi:Gfa-like protein [Salmonella enterica subsp. enterica serovar Heidelberg str. 76-0300]|nr:Gfa-like protein [Salmonella enterica subsp. enterica serovar Heidelberg str. 76-0300]
MTSEKLSAACHCGSVVFTVQLSDGFHTARRCNCSFCRMRGAVAVSAPLSGIKVLKGQDKLTEYRFNTGKAVHFSVRYAGYILSSAPIQSRSIWGQCGVHRKCVAF